MADELTPYVRRDPGDLICSDDWNNMQIQVLKDIQKTREEIQTVSIGLSTDSEELRITFSEELSTVSEGLSTASKELRSTFSEELSTVSEELRSTFSEELSTLSEELRTHRHNSAAELKIPREGIALKAIDGDLIDPAAQVTIGSLTVSNELKVNGALNVSGKLEAGNSDLYFTNTKHKYTGVGNTNGYAAIENAENYGALMLLGRASRSSGGLKRVVKLWDYLQICGDLDVTGNLDVNGTLDLNSGAFLGYETTISDFGGELKSGFYQGYNTLGDVPDTAHGWGWTHLITARHSNIHNNHQLQIASSYAENDRLFFRKIARDLKQKSNPAWHELATKEQEDWQEVSLLNTWKRFSEEYNPAGYFKDNMGIVHLRGRVQNGSSSHIFRLPEKYRPQFRELHVVQCYPNKSGRIDILTDGDVWLDKGHTRWVSLDGITFRAFR